MGARIEARAGRFPPFTVYGAPLEGIEYDLPVASAQVKSCVLLAGLVTERTDGDRADPDARPHRADAAARRGPARARGRSGRRLQDESSATPTSWSSNELEIPGDLSSAAFLIAAGVLVQGSRLVLEDVGVNWTRTGFLRILERMGGIVLGELEPVGAFGDARAGMRPRRLRAGRSRRRPSSRTRCRWRSTSCRSWRCSAASPRARRWSAEPASCGSRSPTGSRPWSRDCADSAAEIEATPDGFVVDGTGGLRGGRLDAQRGSPAGAARRRRRAGVRRRASRSSGWRPPRSPTRASATTWRSCRMTVVAIDGPAGAGKSTVARAVAAALGYTYLDSGAMYRSVALAALSPRRRARRDRRVAADRARRPACCSTART